MRLFNQYRKYVLMAPAGNEGGDGGSGGADGAAAPPSLIGASGGGDPAGGGGSGDSGSGGAGGNNADSGKSASGGSAADWRSTLPKELQENETLKKYTNVSDLAGAYLNASKLIGSDKLPIPNPKTATEKDWENVFDKLGRPALDKYEIKFGEGGTIDKDFAEEFRTNAHKAGLLPQQAQKLADWFGQVNAQAEETMIKQRQAQFDKEVTALRTEWGNAFDAKVGRVNKLLTDMGAAKYFQDKGYGSDPQIFKFLDYAAERLYKDAKLVDGNSGGRQVRTPQEIKAAITKLQTDGAYMTKEHPGHNAAVQEMQDLWKEYHGTVDKK